MKIYVITKGEYSDYHICAATTEKERAEFLRDMASTIKTDGQEAKIEEFDDYAGLTPVSGKAYDVSMAYLTSGEYIGMYSFESPYEKDILHYKEQGIHGKIEKDKYDFSWVAKDKDYVSYTVTVVSENVKKAENIGIDLIQKYRAEELGI